MRIDIPDENIQYLNQQAQAVFVKSVNEFSQELLAEANRLEAVGKSVGGDPEITSSNMSDATLLVRRGYRKKKKPVSAAVIQVIAAISTLITGLAFDFEKIKQP